MREGIDCMRPSDQIASTAADCAPKSAAPPTASPGEFLCGDKNANPWRCKAMLASASMRCDFSAPGVGIRSEASDHGPPGSPPCLHHKLARPPSEKGTAATSPVLKSEAHSPIDRHSDLSTSYACTLLLPPHPRRKPPATSRLPSGSSVAVAFVRDSTILGPVRHVFASGSRI